MPAQHRLNLWTTPWFVSDAAEHEASFLDPVTVKLESSGHGNQREGVGEPVAYFQVAMVFGESLRGQLDRGDDFAGLQVRVALRRVARQAMKVLKCDDPLPGRTRHMDFSFERCKGDAHIRRMRGDAVLAGAKNSVDPVDAVDRRAAAARLALVAGCGDIIEIEAARSLQQIATRGGHVAQLL